MKNSFLWIGFTTKNRRIAISKNPALQSFLCSSKEQLKVGASTLIHIKMLFTVIWIFVVLGEDIHTVIAVFS
jgi:hypothetical protein